jgi:large subunit ribosomal protein L29
MQAAEIRASVAGMEPETAIRELNRKLDGLYQELFNLRFQWSTRQLKNSSRMMQVRHDIARVKTVLREKERELGELEGGK